MWVVGNVVTVIMRETNIELCLDLSAYEYAYSSLYPTAVVRFNPILRYLVSCIRGFQFVYAKKKF
jgi:hypothetical protein